MPNSGDGVDLDLGSPEGREGGVRHPAVVVTAQRRLDASFAPRTIEATQQLLDDVGLTADFWQLQQ